MPNDLEKVIRIENTPLGLIEYSIQGRGTPILFLHGGHSNCKEFLFHKGFNPSDFCLITPSRPGYGNTPLGTNDTPEKAADLIISLMDMLSFERIVVYAVSASGPTGIMLAVNYPDRVSYLILASAVTMTWLEKKDSKYRMAKWLFHPKTERLTWGMVRFFSILSPNIIAKSFYSQFTSNDARRLSKADITELLAAFKHYRSKEGFLCDIHHSINVSCLSEIMVPTLVIHSQSDNSVPFKHANHAHNLIMDSKLEKLDNEWGHMFWIGQDSNDSVKKTIAFIAS